MPKIELHDRTLLRDGVPLTCPFAPAFAVPDRLDPASVHIRRCNCSLHCPLMTFDESHNMVHLHCGRGVSYTVVVTDRPKASPSILHKVN